MFVEILLTLLKGAGYTLLITLSCGSTALVVGLGIAIARELGGAWISSVLSALVYVLRGVPMLVLLFVVFFGLPGIGFDVPPMLAMMLSLGLISGAYLSEVFRGALAAINPNEVLAAKSMGFTRFEILRLIKIPQMMRFSVPGIVNELTTVLKYSPFAYTVGIPEITKQAMALVATTLRGLEIYAAIGLIYFAIYRLLLAAVRIIEKRYSITGFAQE
ncbi:MAG TPA: amino acid ABC transporter permease [Sphingomicrobium sp.]|jgi:polar amino acid transport system permease protein|nr:amino acid ABC transporter permease [Sphingomicrobium sp.]